MRIIIQRVKEASVIIEEECVGKINQGLLLYVGFGKEDDKETCRKAVKKLDGLRLFEDENKKMNEAVKEHGNQILSISQFSLYASLKKGKRPSFDQVLEVEKAKELYLYFNELLKETGVHVECGVFQADMKVHSINEGPLTIMLDTKEI